MGNLPARPRRGTGSIIFALSAVSLSGLVLWLLWAHPYLPMLDEPAIAYSGRVYHWLRTRPAVFSEWHMLQPGITHRLFYELLHYLQWFLPIRVAQKVLVTASVLGLPASTVFFCRVHGRSSLLGLSAFPLGLGYACAMGYTPFLLGVPLIPLLLGLIELGHSESLRPERRAVYLALAAGALAIAFTMHAALAAIGGILAAVWVVLRPAPIRRTVARLTVLGTIGATGAALSVRQWPTIQSGTFEHRSFMTAVEQFPTHFFRWTTEGLDTPAISLWALSLAATAVFAGRGQPLRGSDVRIFTGLVLTCLGYWLTPEHLNANFHPHGATGFPGSWGQRSMQKRPVGILRDGRSHVDPHFGVRVAQGHLAETLEWSRPDFGRPHRRRRLEALGGFRAGSRGGWGPPSITSLGFSRGR